MNPLRTHPLGRRIGGLLPYGLVIALLGTITVLHYLTPQIRRLYPSLDTFLNRHVIERIAFLAPIAVATTYLRRRGGIATLLLAIAAMLPRALWISPYPADALLEVAVTATVGGLVVGIIDGQIRARETNQRLVDTMRVYAQQITHAQEQERERLSRELHDETIQMLVVLSRRLEALSTLSEGLPESAIAQLQGLQDLVRETSRTLRRLVVDLRPPTLQHLGLAATTEAMSDKLAEDLGIVVDVQVRGERVRLPADQELALLRILQEALNNIRRHAGASHVGVCLAFERDATRLTVEDNGCGFTGRTDIGALVSAGQLGLVGMRERAQALGGTLLIRSSPGRGTTIQAEIPTAGPPPRR
jgi:signal transduction histidine kinase